MPLPDKVSMVWQRREILCAWIAWQMEVGDSEEANETMRRVVDRKADLHLDQVVKEKPLNSTDPVTVCRYVADYLTESDYAQYQVGKVSDTIMYRDWKNCVEMPLIPWALQEMGMKVTPNPSTSLFHAALRRFCKIDAKIIRGDAVPKEVQAQTPKEFLRDFRSMDIDQWTGEWTREYWLLSPMK